MFCRLSHKKMLKRTLRFQRKSHRSERFSFISFFFIISQCLCFDSWECRENCMESLKYYIFQWGFPDRNSACIKLEGLRFVVKTGFRIKYIVNISAIRERERKVRFLTQSCDGDSDFGLDFAKLVLSFTHISGAIFNPKVYKTTSSEPGYSGSCTRGTETK